MLLLAGSVLASGTAVLSGTAMAEALKASHSAAICASNSAWSAALNSSSMCSASIKLNYRT